MCNCRPIQPYLGKQSELDICSYELFFRNGRYCDLPKHWQLVLKHSVQAQCKNWLLISLILNHSVRQCCYCCRCEEIILLSRKATRMIPKVVTGVRWYVSTGKSDGNAQTLTCVTSGERRLLADCMVDASIMWSRGLTRLSIWEAGISNGPKVRRFDASIDPTSSTTPRLTMFDDRDDRNPLWVALLRRTHCAQYLLSFFSLSNIGYSYQPTAQSMGERSFVAQEPF